MENNDSNYGRKKTKRPVDYLDIFALVCSIIAIGFTYYQIYLTRLQNALESRAYVNADLAFIHSESVNDSIITIAVPFVNGGRTPAYNVICYYFSFIAQTDVDSIERIINGINISRDAWKTWNTIKDPTFKAILYTAPGNSVIGIGQTSKRISVIEWKFFSQEEIANVISGKRRLYFFERIIYDDVYGKQRITNLCCFWDNTTNRITMAEKYNDSD